MDLKIIVLSGVGQTTDAAWKQIEHEVNALLNEGWHLHQVQFIPSDNGREVVVGLVPRPAPTFRQPETSNHMASIATALTEIRSRLAAGAPPQDMSIIPLRDACMALVQVAEQQQAMITRLQQALDEHAHMQHPH